VPPEKSTMRSGPFSTSADCSMFHPEDVARAIGCRLALHVPQDAPLSTVGSKCSSRNNIA
jgi:hypothetical protein